MRKCSGGSIFEAQSECTVFDKELWANKLVLRHIQGIIRSYWQ